MMAFGSGKYTYEVEVGWGHLPNGWRFGWIPAVACDSKDNVYVYSRSEHPLVIFDRDGKFLDSWGEDILEDAHGIYIDQDDNVWCTERETHCVRKFNPNGELVMTIGTPGQPGRKRRRSLPVSPPISWSPHRANSSFPTGMRMRASTNIQRMVNCSTPGANGAADPASLRYPTASGRISMNGFGSVTGPTTAFSFLIQTVTFWRNEPISSIPIPFTLIQRMMWFMWPNWISKSASTR